MLKKGNKDEKTPTHYQGIQPLDLIEQCVPDGTSPRQSFYYINLLKYAMRLFLKNQPASDLDKIIHYAELLRKDLQKEANVPF